MSREIDRDMPLKKKISQNIQSLIKSKGWNQRILSEKSNISKSTLSDYINCKTLINAGNVEKLAETFGVAKAEIDPSFNSNYLYPVGQEALIDGTQTVQLLTSLPVVGSISCGNGVLAYEDIEGYEDTPKSWLNGGKYFYLRAKGDSMKGLRIHDGDLLLIREQSDFENGEIVATLINGEAFLKRATISEDMLILESANPEYPPIAVPVKNNDIRIIGKLKKVVLDF